MKGRNGIIRLMSNKKIAYLNCIVAACFVALVLFPFAKWYSLIVGVVAAYQLTSLVCEIADERNEKSFLAWSGFTRATIIFLVAALCIATRFFT